MNRFLVAAIICLYAVCGCTRKETGTPRYMAFDDVVYVESFLTDVDLSGTLEQGIDVMGIKNIAICDTITVAVTNNGAGFLTFLSSDDYKELGSYLLRGNGPNEFLYTPNLYQSSFIKRDNSLCVVLYDYSKGKLYKMDITRTLSSGKLVIEQIKDSLSNSDFSVVFVNDSTLLCRKITPDETHQNRYMLKNGRRTVPKHLEILNEARVDRGEDFNIISSIIKYNEKNNRVVEMPVMLNTLNIYSPDGSFTKSVCFGNKVDDILSIQNKPKAKRLFTYSNLQLYDEFICVLYSGIKRGLFGIHYPSPQIHIFDWNGNPLAKLNLSHYATQFDIDFKKQRLYALNQDKEEIYYYDISEILSKLM